MNMLDVIKTGIDIVGVVFELYIVAFLISSLCEREAIALKFEVMAYFGAGLALTCALLLLPNTVWVPLFALILIAVVTCFYKCSLHLKIIYTLITFVMMSLSEFVIGMLMTLLTGMTVAETQENVVTYFIAVIISKFTTMCIFKVIISVFKRQTRTVPWKFTLALTVFPLCSIMTILLVASLSYSSNSVEQTLMSLLVSFLLVFANLMIFEIIENQIKAEITRQRLAFVESQIGNQTLHYHEISSMLSETRKIKHDLKNGLTSLIGLLEKGNVNSALDYLHGLTRSALADNCMFNTGFPAIDAVLQSKYQIIKDTNVSMTCKIMLDEQMQTEQVDLAIIVANALDNAIQATIPFTHQSATIQVSMITIEDYIKISVVNPIYQPVDPGNLRTFKSDKKNHGLGISSIRSIAERYDGSVDIAVEDGLFRLSVMLKNSF